MNTEKNSELNNTPVFRDAAALLILFTLACCCLYLLFGKAVPGAQWFEPKEPLFIDWSEEYPAFSPDDLPPGAGWTGTAEAEEEPAPSPRAVFGRLSEKYLDSWQQLKNRLETNTECLPFRRSCLEAAGLLNRLTGKNDFQGSGHIVRLKNGVLVNLQTEDRVADRSAGNISDFSDWLKEEHIPFLYMQQLTKSMGGEEDRPEGLMKDYTKINTDLLLQFLSDRDVPVLDLRESLRSSGQDLYPLFYRTDHHWNVRGGLWASREIAGELNRRYDADLNLSLLSPENFRETVYPKAFLGSEGTRVTLSYVGEAEDFLLWDPLFPTDLRVENPDLLQDDRGPFEEVMYDREKLSSDDLYHVSKYSALLYGNRPLTRVTNYLLPEGKKALLIRDSFSLEAAPYLSLLFRETDCIDVRSGNGNFNGSVKTYIKKTSPDYVILMYNSGLYEYY